ncbi:MAG: hypothetical protein ACE5JI_00880 [Acidobacteriota bacterium]
MRARYGRWLSAIGLSLLVAACKIDGDLPTTPTENPPAPPADPPSAPIPINGLTIPAIASPEPGSEVAENPPTLVISNSTTADGSTPSYSFQLARDAGFADVVTEASGLAQGPNGQTAWEVPQMLEPAQYFWRARARAGLINSPYTPAADFTLIASPEEGVVVSDPLTGGFSTGEVSGGVFLPEGWQVTSRGDYIRYEVPSIASGFMEWTNQGLSTFNEDPSQFMLFGMWDPSRGAYRANPFRVHIQKLDANHNPPYVRLRWIANGEQHDEGFDFLDWDPERVYQWRIEWGPEGSTNVVRVFLDGSAIIRVDYSRAYQPETHWVELGIAERRESVVGAVYANVRIGTKMTP